MTTGSAMLRGGVTLAALACLAAVAAPAIGPAPKPEPARGPGYVVPPALVLSAQAATAAITVVPGLKVELVASEPAIVAPVAATFDEDGRLWVVEMPAYMRDPKGTGELAPTGRVVVLEDADGDGAFEGRRVFLDGLVLPRAVAPCFGGALVLEPPAVYFCPDEDRDGTADGKRPVITGLGGLDNPEHAGNGLLYGLDNWYHLSQHTLEFRFDGREVTTRRTPGHGQWGITQDDAGRLYYTPNSDPLLADIYPKHYAARNPDMPGAAGMGEPIAGGAKPTFPSRPTPGVNRGYMDGILRKDGTLANLTAACGPSVYRSDALGPGYRNSVFVCEPAGLLVKRLVLGERDGIPGARNAYERSEFLTSTDERFRPVQSLVGPDGGLYLVDMARGLFQHRNFLTPYLKEQAASRGLETPLDLGRIYRVSASGAEPPKRPRLSAATDAELVALLSHTDGWWRDTAQRLLVQRRAAAAEGAVRALLSPGSEEATRLHALWTLEGIGRLTEADAAGAMADESPMIRAAGVRLAEPWLASPPTLARVVELASDKDRRVRIQAAASLGEVRGGAAMPALESILRRRSGDRFAVSAAVSSLAGREVEMLKALLRDPAWPESKSAAGVLQLLADTALRAGPGARTELAELAGEMAQLADGRAWLLVSRVRQAQAIEAVSPRALELLREPRSWIAASGDPGCLLAGLLSESAVYFDWRGRPPVRRPKKLRPMTAAEQALYAQGQRLFAVCTECHMADGRGSPGMAPSLLGSPRVEGPEGKLARILLHGFQGEYTHGGTKFEGVMPPPPLKNDEEIAAVMTYVRRAWGNAAEAVSPALVARVRAMSKGRTTPWTVQELDPPGGFP